MRKPLLALAVSAFGIGTSEFIIMGLLPDLAHSFRISIPKTGILVSGYALSVTFGSPLVALAVSRMDRKRALLILMAMFVGGNILCALAPNFLLLLLARILTALCHGTFFGLAASWPTTWCRAQSGPGNHDHVQRADAGDLLGVPAGTALGQAFGWRFAFWALVPIGVIAGLGLLRMVPHQAAEKVHIKHEFYAVIRPQVPLVLAMSTLSSVALFCVFTYIAPILEQVTHFSPAAVTKVLMVFGVGITVGNLIGGRLADWKQLPVVLGSLMLLIVIFLAMPFLELSVVPAVIVVFVWGCIHFAAGSPLQARIVEQAKGAPNLASTLNQGAFDLGNALGASLGGIMLTEGIGYRYLSWGSAAVACVALMVALVALPVEAN